MITDQLVNFLPYGTNLAITSSVLTSNVYDELGIGSGTTPAGGNVIVGQTATGGTFGSDMDVGRVVPEIICSVGTTFTGSGTLTIAVQGAQDTTITGVPGSWQTFVQSPAYTIAQLVAGQFVGRFKWPVEVPDGFNPRFYRLQFTPSSTFTAGTIAWAQVTMGPPMAFNKFAARNYSVAG